MAAVLAPSTVRRIRDLPSPPALPILGHLTKLDPLRAHLRLEQWARELGTPYHLSLAGMPVVVWDDIDVFHRIMRERPHAWRRGGRIRPVAAQMGFDGLFSTEGDDWEPQRRLVMAALAPSQMRSFWSALRSITQRLQRRWTQAADTGRIVDMTDDLMRYTVDVTSALAFGEDPDTLGSDGDRIQRHLAAIFPMFMKRIMTPIEHWRWIRLPADRALDHHLAVVHAHVHELIERCRARMRREPVAEPRHLLESFLMQQAVPGSGITDDVVTANVLTMLLAGEDTTAHSLAWTMLHLARDPGQQQLLRDEARSVLAEADVCPSIDALRRLDRCEAAVTEAQRLTPVTPLHSFEPLHDFEIGGLALERDTKLFFLNRPAMLDARNFHDPSRYDPDRWLRPRDAHPGPHEPRAFLQFGAGPRVCPGRHLAGVEMRLVISMLMRTFRIELATDPADIEEVSALTCGPDHMPVRLHRW